MWYSRSNLFLNPTKVTMYQCLTTERSCYGWTVKNEIWYCLYIRFTYVLKVLVMAERWKMEILYYLYMRFTYMLKALVMAERWKTKILYQCYRNFTYMINFVLKDEQGNTKILCTMYCALFGYYHCVRVCLVTITVLLCVWLLSRNKKSSLFLDKSKS